MRKWGGGGAGNQIKGKVERKTLKKEIERTNQLSSDTRPSPSNPGHFCSRWPCITRKQDKISETNFDYQQRDSSSLSLCIIQTIERL